MTHWILTVAESPTGRLQLHGLPDDRETRQSIVWRLRDTLAAIAHADAAGPPWHTDGQLWQIYAKDSYRAGWLSEVTVTLDVPHT